MARPSALLAVSALVVAAGCVGGVADQSPTPSASPSATETIADEDAGQRAITAEQARVERVAADVENLTGLVFGTLDPAEYEVRRRNASGVVVRVDVGYSVSVDCDGDGEFDYSLDGANTVATYVVTDERTRLLSVSQGFADPTGHC